MQKLKLAILADEFFHPELQGIGGFGWAALRAAQLLRSNGVEPVFVSGALRGAETTVHGFRVMLRSESAVEDVIKLRRERFDLMLSIDYNLGYSRYLRALPRTPVVIWVRDPRTAEDATKVHACRLPGVPELEPQGLYCVDGSSMARIVREAWWWRRKLLFASPAPSLVSKLAECYGAEPARFHLLPNPIEMDAGEVVKSVKPSVVFLGRLDPIKRPWVFTELARRFPEVDFLVLGQSHFAGAGSFEPRDLAPNVRMLGHTGEAGKRQALREAWATVNTSVHEGLAVSFLESFACETPVVSCQDPGFAVSRFGVYVGRFDGDGMAGLEAFERGLRQLIEAAEWRRSRGREARAWVEAVHSRQEFLMRFEGLCGEVGL